MGRKTASPRPRRAREGNFMARKLPFTKMQGTGNDYVYINGFEQQLDNPCELAKKISDRHFGVGSDGLVLILPSAAADLRMRMFNADGTEAEMCGNASRCVGKFAYDSGLVKKKVMSLETLAGVKIIKLLFEGGEVRGATVDMGEPILAPARVPVETASLPGAEEECIARPMQIMGESHAVTAVSMGNPHAVIFRDDIDDLDLPRIGPHFENNPMFPQKTNTEFVTVLSRTRIRMRVWERGAGETLACGTGACAAVVASALNGYTERSVDVELRGGVLHVDWDVASNHVLMSGPAVTVFSGAYYM